MSEARAENSGGGEVRFSVRDLFKEIKDEIAGMRRELHQTNEDTEKRLAELEHDFTGFTGRFNLHEARDGHPESLRRLMLVEAQCQALASRDQVRSELQQYIERSDLRAADYRRWLIGLGVGSGLTFLTVLIALVRLLVVGHL